MPDPDPAATARLFEHFLLRTHLSTPYDLADVVAQCAREFLGAGDVVLHLVDVEHTGLVAVPTRSAPVRPGQPVDGSMAGRAFTTSRVLVAEADPDEHGRPGRRMWLPLLDGTDRLGVLSVDLPPGGAQTPGGTGGEITEEVLAVWERYAHLVAMTVVNKRFYGDVFERVQRSRPMTVASELVHALLPPLTYSTDGLVVCGMLEPAYDNGGDAFDYAVNEECTHLAVFDGMGHGLKAAGVTALALSAYRVARRTGLDLPQTYAAVNEAVLTQFGGDRHVTAVLAQLDRERGVLRWISAGHPPPLLLRGAQVVKRLQAEPAFPMGWPFDVSVTVAEEQLEPGDAVLLYTDGLIEAPRPCRGQLGMEGLGGFLEQQAAAGQAAPETLRRMRLAVLAHQEGVLQDDATALLVEWERGGERLLLPQTVG